MIRYTCTAIREWKCNVKTDSSDIINTGPAQVESICTTHLLILSFWLELIQVLDNIYLLQSTRHLQDLESERQHMHGYKATIRRTITPSSMTIVRAILS